MQRGFSLLELSIVLVIIGLITGGIMAGRSMVRAAELRSVMSDISKYQTAVQTFREKYNGLPGDLRNAVRYWGAQAGSTADGTDATCQALTTGATGTATCNGDGSGTLTNIEGFRFWQHLANAGLIEGQYSGVAGPSGVIDSIIGVNVPASKISGGGYSIRYLAPPYAGNTSAFAGNYGNFLEFGTKTTTASMYNSIFTPAELFSIDSKIDDGKPALGRIAAYGWPTCTNATSETDTNASYLLTSTTAACAMEVWNFM